MADLAFLPGGSVQLGITATGANNDDAGVDLAGVRWEIEQVIMAGEKYACSPSDVHIDGNGVLIIGKSLIDRVCMVADAVVPSENPVQATIIVKATSLVDPSVVARLKVLVGYSVPPAPPI